MPILTVGKGDRPTQYRTREGNLRWTMNVRTPKRKGGIIGSSKGGKGDVLKMACLKCKEKMEGKVTEETKGSLVQ